MEIVENVIGKENFGQLKNDSHESLKWKFYKMMRVENETYHNI